MTNLLTDKGLEFLRPYWKAPTAVQSIITTRNGGASAQPYQYLNLGDHVGDLPEAVATNRAILRKHLPSEPIWLNQVHGTSVSTPSARIVKADAIVSNTPNEVLAIMTADCLPVLFASQSGSVVGAAHAGWRGLCNGVLENTVHAMRTLMNLSHHSISQPRHDSIMAWLGPAIGPSAFEVGDDVVQAFQSSGNACSSSAFVAIPEKSGKYLADIYLLARNRLESVGVQDISGGNFCTVAEADRFFSYRRDGVTGRFASLIWIDAPNPS